MEYKRSNWSYSRYRTYYGVSLVIYRSRRDSRTSGYNDDMYVLKATFDKQSMQDLLENLIVVRQSTLHLLKSLDKDTWLQKDMRTNLKLQFVH